VYITRTCKSLRNNSNVRFYMRDHIKKSIVKKRCNTIYVVKIEDLYVINKGNKQISGYQNYYCARIITRILAHHQFRFRTEITVNHI